MIVWLGVYVHVVEKLLEIVRMSAEFSACEHAVVNNNLSKKSTRHL